MNEFTFSVVLDYFVYTTGTTVAQNFYIDVTYCLPEFVEIGLNNGFRHVDPVYFIVGKDSEMYIDVPEFMLTDPRCVFHKYVDYWVEKKPS